MTNPWLKYTRRIYHHLKENEQKYLRVKVDLPFTLDEFREWLIILRREPSDAAARVSTWNCYLCSRLCLIDSVSVDHVTPLAHSGRTTLSNLKPCCVSCNRAKGAMSLTGYRSVLETVRGLHPKEQRYFWTRWSAGSRTRWTEARRDDARKAREILKRVSKAEQR